MNNYIIESFIKYADPKISHIINNILEISISLGFHRLTALSYSFDTPDNPLFFEDTDLKLLSLQDSVHLHLPTGMGAEKDYQLVSLLTNYNFKLCLYIHDCLNFPTYDCLKKCTVISVNNQKISDILHTTNIDETAINKISIKPNSSPVHIQTSILKILNKCFGYTQNDYRDTDTVQVAFGLYDKSGRYYINTAVAILSILRHTNAPICFHILHDDTLSNLAKTTLTNIVQEYNCIIQFHNIDVTHVTNYEKMSRYFTPGALFRFFIPKLFPQFSKIIYLDSDILFLKDIKELWETDISGKSFAGVIDSGYNSMWIYNKIMTLLHDNNKNYINTGVLIFNITKLLQNEDIISKIGRFFTDNPDLCCPDQDAINYIYQDDILFIDSSWNCFANRITSSCSFDNQVIHFAGQNYIQFDKVFPSDILLFKYYTQVQGGTDYLQNEYFRGLASAFYKIDGLQKLLNKLAHKNTKKIYYGNYSYAMKNIMTMTIPTINDYIIGPNCNDYPFLPIKDISALNKETIGTFIVFVLPEAANGTAIAGLESLGLKNREDYFVIPTLLPAHQGGYLL